MLGETVLTDLSLIDDEETLRFCSQSCADRHFEAEARLIEEHEREVGTAATWRANRELGNTGDQR